MAATMHVDVVSAEESIFSGEAEFVVLPGEDLLEVFLDARPELRVARRHQALRLLDEVFQVVGRGRGQQGLHVPGALRQRRVVGDGARPVCERQVGA